MTTNRTSIYILPILDFHLSDLKKKGFVNAYLGASDEEVGRYLKLYFRELTLGDEIELSAHPRFLYKEIYDNGVILVYALTIGERDEIVAPFLEGKYSEISRMYVMNYLRNFRLTLSPSPQFTTSPYYKVATKDSNLKELIEKYLDVELPDEAELASIPNADEEIVSFQKLADGKHVVIAPEHCGAGYIEDLALSKATELR
jgi:hypothetical protein